MTLLLPLSCVIVTNDNASMNTDSNTRSWFSANVFYHTALRYLSSNS